MLLSVVIPAHNEEKYIGKAIESVHTAAQNSASSVEIIVVANRCSDTTIAVAKGLDCIVVEDAHRNISKTKNSGVAQAQGELLVTMDADSTMDKNFLSTIEDAYQKGDAIGGQASIVYDRRSLGISFLTLLINMHLRMKGYAGGFYWCTKESYSHLGGFDEKLRFCEDVDFAKRLRAYGKTQGKKYTHHFDTPFISSSRKFDTFGDWHYLRSMFWGFLGKSHRMIKDVDNFEEGYFYNYEENQ